MDTRRNTKERKKDGRACATFDVWIAEHELGDRVLHSVSRDEYLDLVSGRDTDSLQM
jgi:hypothetical protein